MTAPVELRRTLTNPVIPSVWTTVAVGVIDTAATGAGTQAKAYLTGAAAPGSTIEVRAVSESETSPAVDVSDQTGVLDIDRVTVPAGVSTIEIEARTTTGLGALQILDLAVVSGVFVDPTAALFVDAYADIVRSEGATLLLTPPSHNGQSISLQKDSGGGVWVAGGANNKSPADPSDEGSYRWLVVRDAEQVTAEFTVTVTAQATNPTVIVLQPSDTSITDGSTVTLEARAQGEADIQWAWQFFFNNDTWSTIAGESGSGPIATITEGPLTVAQSPRQYRVVFYSNTAGDSAHSDAATVTITSAGFGTGAAVTDVKAD